MAFLSSAGCFVRGGCRTRLVTSLVTRRCYSRTAGSGGWHGRRRGDGQNGSGSNSSSSSSSNQFPFIVTSLSLSSLFTSSSGGGKQSVAGGGSDVSSAKKPTTPVEVSRVMLPDDTNPLGNVHGGTILKLIEQAGAIASARHCNRVASSGKDPLITVLARVEHMDFYQPMYVGEVAQVHAAVTYTSTHSCEVTVEVWAENVLTGQHRCTNRATLWYVVSPVNSKSPALKPVPVPQLEGLSPDEAREGLKRYKAQKSSRAAAAVNSSKQALLLSHASSTTYSPVTEAAKHTVLGSQTTLATLVLPSDCARGMFLMGGPLMKMMDNAAGICAARHSRGPVVTACIDAIDFHAPVHNGEAVFCTARLVFCSEKSMVIEVITEAEGLTPGSRRVANTAYFTFVSIGLDRRAQKVPQLVLTTDEERQRFDEEKLRYEERKQTRMLEKSKKKT